MRGKLTQNRPLADRDVACRVGGPCRLFSTSLGCGLIWAAFLKAFAAAMWLSCNGRRVEM